MPAIGKSPESLVKSERLPRNAPTAYAVDMRVLIVANGDMPSNKLLGQLRAEAELVVAADGGANKALGAGITPDAVVGDLDSVSGETRDRLGSERLHHDSSPDTTDLQKAIEYAIEAGARSIDIVAAGGGRADHALANLSVLRLYRGKAQIRIVDDQFDVEIVDGQAELNGPAGTVVSLVAIGRCTGVTTSGLRWDLRDHTLDFSPYGVHNEIARSPASISVVRGDLLLFRGRWVEKHA